jgi:hypothetical protein
MSLYNRAQHLQQIVDNPSTPREEYMHAWVELQNLLIAYGRVLNAADKYHNGNDNLTGGQNV